MLRDRIFIGVLDKKLQQKLLSIINLTLEKAVDMCRASELAKAQAKFGRDGFSSRDETGEEGGYATDGSAIDGSSSTATRAKATF
ncbi:unnamed protein product, partial [Iphiclides podalirius]